MVAIVGLTGLWHYQISEQAKKPGGGHIPRAAIGSLNRAQQANYLERGRFASSLKELNQQVNSSLFAGEEYANHIYLTVNLRQAAFNYVLAKQNFRKSYVGGVFVVKEPGTNEFTTEAIACEVTDLTREAIELPISARQCGAGTTRIEP